MLLFTITISAQQDKLLHFSGGVGVYYLADLMNLKSPLAITAMVGLTKEIYDYNNRDSHTPELADFLATVFGGLLMWQLRW